MEERFGFVEALKNSDFRTLWLGQLISQVGDSFAIIAVLVMINELTDSTLALGAMVMAVILPQLLFGLIAGVIVDRFNRKVTMMVSDIVRGLAILALLAVHRADQIPILLLVGFVMSSVGVFFNPARNAVIPNLVREDTLLAANALSQISQVIATVFGPALAGLAISFFGTSFAFAFDSLTFFLSATAIATIAIPSRNYADEKTSFTVIREQLVEGVLFIRQNRIILSIMITAAVAMLGLGALTVLGVVYLEEELGIGAEGLGFLNSIQGVGMVIGGIAIGNLVSQARSHWLVSGGMIVLGLAIASFSLAPHLAIALVAAFIVGTCLVSARATMAAMLQAIVPDEKRGRVESAFNTMITLATMASMGLAGILGDLIGVRPVFLIAGLITIAAGASAFFALRPKVTSRDVQ